MKERSFDQKQFQACPDDFDIIKVTTFTAGAKLKKDMIVYIVAVDADNSGLPAGSVPTATILIKDDIVLKGNDSVKLVGYRRNYSAIQLVTKPTFANDETSVVVAGVGKNMSLFNTVEQPIYVFGYFNRIQIPSTSTDTIIIAYK